MGVAQLSYTHFCSIASLSLTIDFFKSYLILSLFLLIIQGYLLYLQIIMSYLWKVLPTESKRCLPKKG